MRSGGPRVTVGIPTRNRCGWLREAIDSVLAQTYREFRLVISDNASTDDTPSLAASLDDPRIAYVRSEVDLGMFGNLNRVAELAETEYVVVLPDDDVMYPDYLGTVVELLEHDSSLSVAHSAFDLMDPGGSILGRGPRLLASTGPVTLETGPS